MLSDNQRQVAESLVNDLLKLLGHDTRSGDLKKTPKRFVKFLEEYSFPEEPEISLFSNVDRSLTSKGDHDISNGMVVQSGIPITSLCEHHLAPIIGYATIGYLPLNHIIGLSKLTRVAHFFAKRLQNQERITSQIADYLKKVTNPKGLGVRITAQHGCMACRGVEVQNVWTTTTELRGAMLTDPATRAEFLAHHPFPKAG